jgi:hypothetical protein
MSSFGDELKDFLFDNNKTLEIEFDSDDVSDIANKMDRLVSLANESFSKSNGDVNTITPKIRAGILRLTRLEEYELSVFYQQELDRIEKKSKQRILLIVILVVILFSAIGAMAVFG